MKGKRISMTLYEHVLCSGFIHRPFQLGMCAGIVHFVYMDSVFAQERTVSCTHLCCDQPPKPMTCGTARVGREHFRQENKNKMSMTAGSI